MRHLLALAFLSLLVPALASASPGQHPPPSPEAKEWQRAFYPAELIMKHQDAIQLSEKQRRAIMKELKAAQSDYVDMQFELYKKSREALAHMQKSRVDEQAALAAGLEAMKLESKIKQRHMRTAIRIKNILSARQQKKLDSLRAP